MVKRRNRGDFAVTLDLKSVSWAVAVPYAIQNDFRQSFDVRTSIDRAVVPFAILFVALRQMMTVMLGFGKKFKVFNDIVRVIMVLVMYVKGFLVIARASRNRPVVMHPQPDVVRDSFPSSKCSPFAALVLPRFESFQRVTGGLPTLVVKRTPTAGVNSLGAFLDAASAPLRTVGHRFGSNLGFQWIASDLPAGEVKTAPVAAKGRSVAIGSSASPFHGLALYFGVLSCGWVSVLLPSVVVHRAPTAGVARKGTFGEFTRQARLKTLRSCASAWIGSWRWLNSRIAKFSPAIVVGLAPAAGFAQLVATFKSTGATSPNISQVGEGAGLIAIRTIDKAVIAANRAAIFTACSSAKWVLFSSHAVIMPIIKRFVNR